MKQICLLCDRLSPDSNLYCQETFCPAEQSPNILDYGEWLGDIEIVKTIIILRTAVLYEATHHKKKVLLKVAHPGYHNKERLKREAEFLKHMQKDNKQHELLPTLLPPYANTTIEQDPLGKAMLKGHLLYFYLFEHKEGEPLRDVLKKNPQLWINHVGWLMISLATAVNFLHNQSFYHLAISPDTILLHFDKENIPRLLLFDLGVVTKTESFRSDWYPFFVPPAYTAPELINGQTTLSGYEMDVYGLGVTLYELLIGEPAYTFKLHSDAEVYRAVLKNRRMEMNRVEDVKEVANIALKATNPQPIHRQRDASAFAKELQTYFGEVPEPQKSRWPSLNNILIAIAALLAIAFLIAFAVSLNEFTL